MSIKKEDYSGKIYDVDVPNDIVLVKRDGLVVWSGNSNNGTAVGNATQTTAGKLGKGMSFDGNGDYVDTLFNGTQYSALTFSFWAKTNELPAVGNNYAIDNSPGDTGYIMRMANGESYMYSYVYLTNGGLKGSSAITIPDTKWHYYTLMINSTYIGLSIDAGIPAKTTYSSDTINASSDTMVIGGMTDSTGDGWNGSIDDVMIFNRSLSSDEIRGLYANTSTKYLGVNFTGLADGTHTFKAYVQDLGGNVNATEQRQVTITTSTAPNTPTVSINSTDGSNKTAQDLNCYATITDPDAGSTLNVSVQWFKNNTLNLTVDYNNSYATGIAFNATLDDANTTKNDVWSCGMRLYDGTAYSAWANSSNLTIVNTAPTVSLLLPASGNITTDRTPDFNWSGSDDDSDALAYEINITCIEAGSVVTVGSEYIAKEVLGSAVNYTPANYLKCLSDNAQVYNWSVRAYDGSAYSAWASPWNLSVQSLLTISLPVSSVNFGAMSLSSSENTSDDSPAPLVLSNNGNTEANISVNFTNLWNTQPNPSSYFKYKIRNTSGGCYVEQDTQSSWANTPSITAFAINRLNFTSGYQSECSNTSVDVHIQVPANEPSGNKSSIVTFISSLGERKVS